MEVQSEISQQMAASEEDKSEADQVSLVIEIQDSPSATECEEEARPCAVKMEEKSFVSGLYCFMKDKGSPIERIPHLGFKQINLWRIYKAVEKLGGYDSVTARRLWKNVYDELGGSPGSTSAATCTRRHYERLVLPFERHIKGEEDKPLPASKPRKPYKRNLDGKVSKTEGKRKRTDRDSELIIQGSPDAGIHTQSSLWASTSEGRRADGSQPSRGTGDLCTPVYTCAPLLQVPTSSPWIGHIPIAAGEVISPLEKKKRVAQASLNLTPSPQSEDRDRPSVICCSPSTTVAASSHNCNSSEGSPLPLSSSSSRSASPDSVSSEDGPAGREDKPASNTELAEKSSSNIKNTPVCKEERPSEKSKDLAGQRKNASHTSSQPVNTGLIRADIKDCAWKHMHKAKNVFYSRCQLPTPSSCTVKSEWVPASTSSFSKVVPKYSQLLRPAPIRPNYKAHPSRMAQQDNSLTCVKKMINVAPWLYHADKWEKSRMPKPPLTQQSPSRSSAPLPVSYVLGESRHQAPPHPEFHPSRMRLSQSQPVYSHIPVSPVQSALIGSAIYSYPYPFPVWSPQTGYTLPAMNSVYPHKL